MTLERASCDAHAPAHAPAPGSPGAPGPSHGAAAPAHGAAAHAAPTPGAPRNRVDTSPDTIHSVAIVVPARNEQQLIARCLRSIDAAIAETRRSLGERAPHIVTVVAVDSSSDDTELIARSFPGVSVLTVDARSVGAARRAGADLALGALARVTGARVTGARVTRDDPHPTRADAAPDPTRVWIANTDADSAVPPTWLLEQLALAEHGADVMIGTVRPDFADLTPQQVDAWLATHVPGAANGHVHGANLGLRASLYERAGRFQPLDEHEDVDLVGRLRALDARIVPSAAAEVLTSGRQAGRTPGGYAGYLRTALVPPA